MVLHSRGCGRVARRRFTCWASRSSLWLPGGPFFMLSFRASRRASLREPPFFIFLLSFLPSGRIPCGFPEGPFLFIPLFFFPLVSLTWIPACGGRVIRVPDAGEWCRSGCHPGLLRAADSPGDRGFHGPGRCGSPFRVFWVPNRCHSGTDVSSGYHHGIGVVSSGYRRDVWVASFGYGLVSFRYQSVHSGVSDGVALGHLIHGLGGVTTTVPRASGLSLVRKAQGDAFSCRRHGLTRLDKDAVLGYRLRPSGMDHVRYR